MITYNQKKIYVTSSSKKSSLFDLTRKSSIVDYIESKIGENKSLVFIVGKNSEIFCVLFSYFLGKGVPFLVIPAGLKKNSLVNLISTYKPRMVITEFQCDLNVQDQLVIGELKISFFQENCEPVNKELALMILTSGSTGSPQACLLSYSNIVASSEAINKTLDMSAGDVAVTTLPPSYIYGLSIIFSHFAVGASIFIQNEPIISRNFWNNLNAIGNANFGAVPTQYEMLKKVYGAKLDLNGLRYITQAGGGMSVDLKKYVLEKCKETTCDFYVMYGQTEAAPRICVNKLTKNESKIYSVGKVVPGGKISLRNMDKNGVGELCYEGPNVFQGYATSEKDLVLYDPPVILNTGDLARIDQDEYIEIVGRIKRITKVNGIRTNLDSIEGQLREKFGQCAVVSAQDDQLAIFFIKDGTEKQKIEVSKYVGLHINKIKFLKLTEFPLTENQKIDYNALVEMLNG